jgi:hypothetical protein
LASFTNRKIGGDMFIVDKIKNFFKKKVIKMGIKYLVNEIEKVEVKSPEVKEFRCALYCMSVPKFMQWGLEKMEGESLETITPIQLFEKRLVPLRDDIEGIILQVLEGLKTSECQKL